MTHDRLSISLFGLDFSGRDAGAILAEAEAARSDRPRLVVTANIDHVITLSRSESFRRAYADAAARTLDGMPLVWLARLRGERGARRVTGHDLLDAALAAPADEGRRVFLLPASEEAGRAVQARFAAAGFGPDQIAWEVPPFGFEADADYGRALAARIRRHGTTLLLMGVGAPKSEIWVHLQGAALGSPVVLAVGEALNVMAGLVRRAPPALQRLGLEWLFRFGTQPRRLFGRYFVRSWRFLELAARDADLGRAG